MAILPAFQISKLVSSEENECVPLTQCYSEKQTNSAISTNAFTLPNNLNDDKNNNFNNEIVNKKRMVIQELKNNSPNQLSHLYKSDSVDGEPEANRELSCYSQNHAVNKNLAKSNFSKMIKLGIHQYPLLKKSGKVDQSLISTNILAEIHKKKNEKENKKEVTDDSNVQSLPHVSKLIRVNSSKNFKSIYNHKAGAEDSEKAPVNYVVTKSLNIDLKKEKSSREHFYKSFSLLVKLGGRNVIDANNKKVHNDNLWQVKYNELLWLEIRAWQFGNTVEEEDNRLQEERFKIEKVLDEVIMFKFSMSEDDNYKNGDEDNKEKICSKNYILDNINSVSGKYKTTVFSQKSLITDEKDSKANPNSYVVISHHQDFFDKKRYVGAMKVVVELLKKVDNVEKLYPSRESLINEHFKYKDVKFVRNYEALLFWRNINIDIFQTMYMLSKWINIDLEDQVVWGDWFLHGLELAHFQVKHSFYNSKWCSGSIHDVLKNSSASLLADPNKVKKGRKGKHFHHLSVIEQTSTSRYRSFVETQMRTSGFFGLMRRVKNLLKSTLVKGQFIFSDQTKDLSNNELDNSSFLKKEPKNVLNIVNSLSPVSPNNTESDFSMSNFGNGVQYAKACQEMCLPSFLDNYFFLTRVPIDIVHESVRFRIECKPKVEPSYLSIRQMIHECKEVISGSVMSKHYYKSIISPFLSEVSQNQVYLYNTKIREFEGDLKLMLNLYFDYLQHWIKLVHKMEKTSENLKNILDEEWSFTKEICMFVHEGESIGAYKFCVMVSDILKSSSQYLKDSVGCLFSDCKLQEDCSNFRQKIATVCFECKNIINEVRARATKGLGFAKMLCKDLGIAAKYDIISSYEKCFSKLKSSNHVLIEHDLETEFLIFAPSVLTNRKGQCKQLISLIRGYDDPDRSWCMDGYIILLKCPTGKPFWKGRRSALDFSNDLDIVFSNIKVEGLVLICSNSFNLNSQKKNIEKVMAECIKLTSEQTSSHHLIEKSLEDMNNSALLLANVIVSAIEDIGSNLDTYYSSDKAKVDTIYAKKLCVGSMHLCFSLGFEYLREVFRLFTGQHRLELSKLFIRLSKIWMNFVMTKTERGRGTRPRWAAQGMEFLIAAIDPINLEQLSGDEFQSLKSEMQACARHVIGTYATNETKTKESHSNNLLLKRSRSLTQNNKSPDSPIKDEKQDSKQRTSLTLEFPITHTSSEPTLPHGGDSMFLEELYEESIEDAKEVGVPVIVRVRNSIKEIEERRTAKLQHMGVIGSVTYKKPDLAVELMQLNFRRVHFKWQLGNKIGEGQFGKVFSCINLDTGELMAMKQIRFNPNDYATIQSIADEITNVQSVKHESLVKYYGVEVHKDEMLIFMEYCEDGTIAEVAKLGLPESLIRVYTYQIIKAVDFLHQNGIIHRDIKGIR
nr:mitogen-activated protein kinase kinase kinase 4-like isoform X2 [Hydra vulgaris]